MSNLNTLFRAVFRAGVALAKLVAIKWKRYVARLSLAVFFLLAEEIIREYIVDPIIKVAAQVWPAVNSPAMLITLVIAALMVLIIEKSK
jgi:hypothetical protein